MQEIRDWKQFINQILIDSGQFTHPTFELKNQTVTETFKSTDTNSLTEIRVGYLREDLLIFLQIFNPTVPGYNKYVEGEYFYNNDFDLKRKPSKVGLEYDEYNKAGVLEILKHGLVGKEKQYYINDDVLKSVLDIYPEHFLIEYDFTERSFIEKLLTKKVENRDGIKSRTIDLSQIFKGLNNVLQHGV